MEGLIGEGAWGWERESMIIVHISKILEEATCKLSDEVSMIKKLSLKIFG